MSEYYGCEIIKDEEVYKLDFLLSDKKSFLDCITKIRELTKSDEPLILVPTRQKGKSSSASNGSCHWAVSTMVQQHLGKIFSGFAFFNKSADIVTLRKESEIMIDTEINHILGIYHSVWVTPEEKAVNIINYKRHLMNLNRKPNYNEEYLDIFYPQKLLMLPTNQNCSFKNVEEQNFEITYNDIHYLHKRKKSIFEYEAIKKLCEKYPNLLKDVKKILKDETMNIFNGFMSTKLKKKLLNKILFHINPMNRYDISNVNTFEHVASMISDIEGDYFFSAEPELFEHKHIFCSSEKESQLRDKNILVRGEIEKLLQVTYAIKDWSWWKKKDLFKKPSLISKKYHYEVPNHPEFNDKLEYKIIDKQLVDNQIKKIIESMSESQKNYEMKRAEKKGITLEKWLLEQKFKLAS